MSEATPLQGYARNEEAIAAEAARLEKAENVFGNQVPTLRLQTGGTIVRVLPNYSPEGVFFKKIERHYLYTAGEAPFIVLCPARTNGDDCPVCDRGAELFDTKDEQSMELAKSLKPQTKYLYNVLCFRGPQDKNGNVPEFGKVYVMEAGIMVHRQIFGFDQDEGGGWADITNVSEGVNLYIKKSGIGFDTKYAVAPTADGRTNIFEELTAKGHDPLDAAKFFLYNLDEVYTLPPTEELEKAIKRFRVPNAPSVAAPQFAPAPTQAPPVVETQAPQPIPQAPAVTAGAPVPPPVIPAPPTPEG